MGLDCTVTEVNTIYHRLSVIGAERLKINLDQWVWKSRNTFNNTIFEPMLITVPPGQAVYMSEGPD